MVRGAKLPVTTLIIERDIAAPTPKKGSGDIISLIITMRIKEKKQFFSDIFTSINCG